MNETIKTILTLLGGGVGVAIIGLLQKRMELRLHRKYAKEDKAEERGDKLDEINSKLDDFIAKQNDYNEQAKKLFKDMETSDNAQQEGMKYVLLDRIIYLGQGYIEDGEVTYDDRKRLGDMHDVYHGKLGGNGDADAIMQAVYELPLRK